MKALITLVILTTLPVLLLAQPGAVLDDYIKTGIENNLSLQKEDLAVDRSMEALRQARGLYMPEVSFQASYLFAGGGRNIAIPIGDLLNPVYSSLNKLSDSNSFPTNLQNSEEQLLPNRFHDTRLQVRQPLFQPEIYHNVRAQESLVGAQQAQRDVYRQELVKEIKVGYYNYLTTVEALQIYASTEQLLKELVRVNTKLVENHKATIDAVYRAEFELTDLYGKIAEAEQLNSRARTYFNFLLNRNLDDSIRVDRALVSATSPKSLDALQQDALSAREEITQINYAQSAGESLLSVQRSARLPSVALGANVGFQGFDYTFDQNQDYYTVQLSLSVPLFTGFRNKSKISEQQIALAQLDVQKEELSQQIRFQVIDAYRLVESAQFALKAKEASRKSAEKSFQIIARKYKEDQSTLLDLLDARTKFTTSQLELVVAKYDLLKAEASLERTIAIQNYE